MRVPRLAYSPPTRGCRGLPLITFLTLAVVGLAVWLWLTRGRLSALERRLRALELEPRRTPAPSADAPRAPPLETETGAWTGPAWAEAPPRSAAPPVSRPAPPAPAATPEASMPAAPAEPVPAALRPAPAVSTPRRPNLGAWLAENGLAWLGGGALALGGALLAGYAASHGFFTPPMRLFAATLAGLAMLAAGEFIRRRGANPLAAAAASGAGAATLYAADWAAHSLYGYIGLVPAAALLAAVSGGLFGLALIHGEALAVLAVVGGLLAPALIDPMAWSDPALNTYLLAVGAAGLMLAGRRDWLGAALVALVGLALAACARRFSHDAVGADLLLTAGAGLAVLAVQWRPVRPDDHVDRLAMVPTSAMAGACAVWASLNLAYLSSSFDRYLFQSVGVGFGRAALTGTTLIAIATSSARLKLMRPGWIGAAAAAVALAIVWPGPTETLYGGSSLAWWLAPIMALLAAGACLARTGPRRLEGVLVSTGGAVVAVTLARDDLTFVGGPYLFLVVALAASLCAWRAAAASADRRTDYAIALFIAAAGEAAGLAIHAALAGPFEPAAYAGLGAALAVLSGRLGWRGFAESAAIAILAGLIALLSRTLAGAALTGAMAWNGLAVVGGLTVIVQTIAWLLMPAEPRAARESASTTAVVTGLTVCFLALHLLVTVGAGARLGDFTAEGLRTDMLMATGLALTVRGGSSVLARARGPVFVFLGLAHGVYFGLTGDDAVWKEVYRSPPLLDAFTVAQLAPALLAAAAARRFSDDLRRLWGPVAALAFAFLAVWMFAETHRLFHPISWARNGLTHAEAAVFGVIGLGLAWIATLGQARRALKGGGAITEGVVRALRFAAIGWALVFAGLVASPWWGPIDGPVAQPLAFYLGETAVVALIGGFWARAQGAFASLVRVSLTLQIFVVLTLAIRFAFHGATMHAGLAHMGWETWTYSAVWALFGLGVLSWASRGGDAVLRGAALAVLFGTTAKVFLFDMSTLDGVVRATSFLALGAVLTLGAVVARRLGARN